MNREQQIKEIAEDLEINDMVEYDYTTSEDIDEQSNIYYDEPTVNINYKSTAKTLVEAGYGHIPTAIKEFAEKLTEQLKAYSNKAYDNNDSCGLLMVEKMLCFIDELLKEYE